MTQLFLTVTFAIEIKPMNLILFDDARREHLLPFTFTRACCDLRVGISTIREKWEQVLSIASSTLTTDYLSKKFHLKTAADNLFINGRLLPDKELIKAINALQPRQQLIKDEVVLAARMGEDNSNYLTAFDQLAKINYDGSATLVNNSWDIFKLNDAAIRSDFARMTHRKISASIDASNHAMEPGNIFIEAGAKVMCAVLNASTGPIYIAKDAEVMEGCMIRGPFALGEQAVLKMGAKVYGATTIGNGCKVGGEVSNSVMYANSNKAHDGFLGNSVIGEWCNLGADTNNSNLKNNYSEVKAWSYADNDYVNTSLQFCGLMMGDHSKCGINTMFNTGTVVGVCANIFGAGFPKKFIPSFYWGSADESEMFLIDKAIDLARRVYERRGKTFDADDKALLEHLFMMQLKPGE